MQSERIETKGRLVAKLVRELLARDTYTSIADLAAALKAWCRHLGIVYTNEDINEAFRLIESNRPLPFAARRGELTPRVPSGSPRPHDAELGSRGPQFSQRDALEALERVRRGPSC
jgi:uncharacterized protein (DUF2164 family)